MTEHCKSDQEFLDKFSEIMEANLHNENFGVSELADAMGMSRSNLHRKVSKISKVSASQFIREYRLQQAIEMLREESYSVSEVSYKVGFGSAAYFTKCFHDYYGITPGDVLRGLRADEEKTPQEYRNEALIQKKSAKKRWAAIVSAVLLMAAIVLIVWVVVKLFSKNNDKKSIAVLPFVNDSADTTNVYFVNGIMEGITERLSAIKDLRVVSRSSVELYRNRTDISIRQIARELKVDYLVEGSCQKLGDQIKLSVQLIEGKTDNHLFSQSYTRRLGDIFKLQRDIALSVASKINAKITPEEKIQIEEKPTENIASYNYYLQAQNLSKVVKNTNWQLYKVEETLYKKAIQLDSTYADPWVHLGWIYAVYHGDLDSAMILVDRALQCDSTKAKAMGLKGWILKSKGRYKESEQYLKLAIKYNPNALDGYHQLAVLCYFLPEYAKSIEYELIALKIEGNTTGVPHCLNSLRNYLTLYGLYEEALKFAQIQIENYNDSLGYYECVTIQNISKGDYAAAYRSSQGVDRWANGGNWWRPFTVTVYQKNFKKALELPEKATKDLEEKGQKMNPFWVFGYVYKKTSDNEKADYHFDGFIKWALDDLKKKDDENVWEGYYQLMAAYSAKGDKTKAMEYFRKMKTCVIFPIYPLYLFNLKTYPTYETIRNETEVQEFISENEAGLKAECIKIQKMLDNYWAEL